MRGRLPAGGAPAAAELPDARRPRRAPTGTTGEWNSFTGSSGGWTEVQFDLSAYAGAQVEVAISYVTDPFTGGDGLIVDDTRLVSPPTRCLLAEGFEEGLGDWSVPGAPEQPGQRERLRAHARPRRHHRRDRDARHAALRIRARAARDRCGPGGRGGEDPGALRGVALEPPAASDEAGGCRRPGSLRHPPRNNRGEILAPPNRAPGSHCPQCPAPPGADLRTVPRAKSRFAPP